MGDSTANFSTIIKVLYSIYNTVDLINKRNIQLSILLTF